MRGDEVTLFVPRGDPVTVVEVVEDPEIRTDDDSVAEIRGDADTIEDLEWVRVTQTLGVIVVVEEIDIVNRADAVTDIDTVFSALAILDNESETDDVDDIEIRGDVVTLFVFSGEAEFELDKVPERETETLGVKVLEVDIEFVLRGDIVSVVEVVEDPEVRTDDDSVAEIRGDADTEAEPE